MTNMNGQVDYPELDQLTIPIKTRTLQWVEKLTKKIQDRKNTSQVTFKERIAHLTSYSFFTRNIDQYKNTSIPQLYQPPRWPFSQNTYH